MEIHDDILNEELSEIKNLGFNSFAELVNLLGTSTKTNEKLKAITNYFATAPDADKVWVIAIFSGRRPKRIVNSTLLSLWCMELTGLPAWMYEECYHTVGDLGETIALLLPPPNIDSTIIKTEIELSSTAPVDNNHTLSWYLQQFILLEKKEETIRKEFILNAWSYMDQNEKFVFNKLITGGFRIGVSQKTIVNALAKTVELDASIIAHRISGNWDPNSISFADLMNESDTNVDSSKPYPFYLAYALDDKPETLGDIELWQAEWKWDGIRGQIIKRNDELFVWSRGEELVTDKFPEYQVLKDLLPNGTVLDGEILTHANEKPLPFAMLQTRIGRKNITKKQLTEAPVAFFSYDILEYEGQDIRNKSLSERRNYLEEIVTKINNPVLMISPIIEFNNWDELAEIRKLSREMNSEGIMLKRKSSIYQVGRKVGDWWKWKIDPLTIDCVMIYAQKGHGRRSNLYTDYTFAVKDGDKLVSFTKAYSGLTDKEFNEVDNFVKRNSIEKFGPVRTVKPELVFEIAFEGIAASNRHKSGVALRFPRMLRWRKDKKADEINTLDDLKALLKAYGTAEKTTLNN